MKIEVINEDSFTVYYTDFDETFSFEDENEIRLFLKGIVTRLKKKFGNKINGYYELKVYTSMKILILEFHRIEDYSGSVDLNIVMYLNSNIYFSFEESDLFKSSKLYLNGLFYVPVSSILDFLPIIEFGTFIYGYEAEIVKENAKIVK